MVYAFKPWFVKTLKIIKTVLGVVGGIAFINFSIGGFYTGNDMEFWIVFELINFVLHLGIYAAVKIQIILEKDEEKRKLKGDNLNEKVGQYNY